MGSILAILLWLIGGCVAFLIWFFFLRGEPDYWFIIIWGTPGSGKSLEQARMSYNFLRQYKRTEKKYPKLTHRILVTNQTLNLPFIQKHLKVSDLWMKEHYLFWHQPEQFRYCSRAECARKKTHGELHDLHDVDLIIDEGALLFPADGWSDTPMWMRELLKEHRHNGVRVRMLTQDYADIVIHARRCAKQTYYMEKHWFASRDIAASLPPVPFVYGWYTKQRVDPLLIGNDPKSMLSMKLSPDKVVEQYSQAGLLGWRRYHWISSFKISLYDTTQKVEHFEIVREIEHIEVDCKRPGCVYTHKTHRIK